MNVLKCSMWLNRLENVFIWRYFSVWAWTRQCGNDYDGKIDMICNNKLYTQCVLEQRNDIFPRPILLTWINFNPCMDK